MFLGTPVEEVTPVNIMVLIKAYCDVNSVPLYDTINKYDKTKDRTISRVDFLSAFDVSMKLIL